MYRFLLQTNFCTHEIKSYFSWFERLNSEATANCDALACDAFVCDALVFTKC